MNLPRALNEMSIADQEIYLLKILTIKNGELDYIRRLLASVRGGKKVELKIDINHNKVNLKD